MKVLGDRPYPLKESIREYLDELEKRKEQEIINEEIDAAAQAMEPTDEPADTENKTTQADDDAESTKEEGDQKQDESSNIDDVNNKKK